MAKAGGARRTPVQQLAVDVEAVLSQYFHKERYPFDWKVYNTLTPSQAASGVGLLQTIPLTEGWVAQFPCCDISARQFSLALDKLLLQGALSRFGPSHPYWSAFNILDAKSRGWWIDRQYAKVMCVLGHLRRLKTNPVKKQQALKGLDPVQTKCLQDLLAKIVLPDKDAKAQPGSSWGIKTQTVLECDFQSTHLFGKWVFRPACSNTPFRFCGMKPALGKAPVLSCSGLPLQNKILSHCVKPSLLWASNL